MTGKERQNEKRVRGGDIKMERNCKAQNIPLCLMRIVIMITERGECVTGSSMTSTV